jgi:D-glycero-D-manno-heptose 1,7-bisphosphate phosphatase
LRWINLIRAVFLDRDGVLNQDPPHYAHRLDQLALIPRSDDAVRLLKDYGYFLVIISNQSGVARGYYTETQISVFNNALLKEIRKKGGDIDAVYYCPHHPEAVIQKYKQNCDCRKPKAGMIFQAAREYDIDLRNSFVVGDKLSDIEAGKNAGCQTIMVLTGHGNEEVLKNNIEGCVISSDLFEAVNKYIIGKHRSIDKK